MTTADPDLATRTAQITATVKTEGGYPLTYALASQELVTCPRCDQWPGMACRTSGGWQLIGVHAGRRDIIAAMSDDERIATYAAEKARCAIAREDWERRNADPRFRALQEARRAEVRAAADEIRERQRAEERERRERCADPWIHRDDCRCREPGWQPPHPPPDLRGKLPVADLAAERARRAR